MKKSAIAILSILGVLTFTSCETLNLKILENFGNSQSLSMKKITEALKQSLEIGTEKAVKQLSVKGGFSDNPSYHMKLPKELDNVTDTLKTIGLGSLVDNFELKMNRAAEKASASAAPVFLDAIASMSFDDAKRILNGSNSEATEYLRKTTYKKLATMYRPIIRKSINDVGAGKIYNELMQKYDAIPFKSKPDFSLENYVTDNALNAMFSMLAQEEQKIRKDPAARTTELLKEVFGRK